MAEGSATTKTMTRYPNWPIRLEQFFKAEALRTFAWGIRDCGLMACAAIEAMTGSDVRPPFAGHYSSANGALRAMLRFSGGDLEAVAEKLAKANDVEEIPLLTAQRGDAVLVDTLENGPALGILGLDGWTVLFASPEGLSRIPLGACRRAWRIG